jgi:hypothetical protein
MRLFRRIVEDYEARLAPPGPTAIRHPASGKAEHERFEDGEIQFEVRTRRLELANGTEVEIRLNGEAVSRVAVARGAMSLRLSNHKGDTIPTVRTGDRLEIVHRGEVVLAGSFLPD